ncbi:hypothetical protein NEIMUCOT_06674 [Neisseria mucosa ATCC 25996]|uniref:Uncharacterized protein n=1 Tax=Neisseria mucosa (strain ATCC 25996 / DSM 4631 / NCTC 10774 / M26) TaxID=546266 RepID=D3A180_NEIM2|nr:hypothetical protein NEIMUCOT_06674 [Neisseria mucosa ATCC 25996]
MRYHYIFYYHILYIILVQTILNISNFTISQRPLQKSPSTDSRNPKTGFRLFPSPNTS